MIVLPHKPYTTRPYNFANLRGREAQFPNGLTARYIHMPDSRDEVVVLTLYFGSANEGSLPEDTSHMWEHAMVSTQEIRRLKQRFSAEVEATTDVHQIDVTAICPPRRAPHVLAYLCQPFYQPERGFENYEIELEEGRIEWQRHADAPEDEFRLSRLKPHILAKNKELRSCGFPHDDHYDAIGVEQVRKFHNDNVSPERISVTVVSPIKYADSIFRPLEQTIGRLEPSAVAQPEIKVSYEPNPVVIKEPSDSHTFYVGSGILVPPEEGLNLAITNGIVVATNRLQRASDRRKGVFYHPTSAAEDIYWGHLFTQIGPTNSKRPERIQDGIDTLSEAIYTIRAYGNREDIRLGKIQAKREIESNSQDPSWVAQQASAAARKPSDTNTTDLETLMNRIDRAKLDGVFRFIDMYCDPGRYTYVASGPIKEAA